MAFSDRAAWNRISFPSVEHAQHREEVGIGVEGGNEEFQRRRPGDLGFALEGGVEKVRPSPIAS